MALFESASKQLVKDTGRSSLHPVVDLNSASQCRVMCVVERKKSRWLWKSTKYLPTPFTLNEILTKPIDVSGKLKTKEFVANYSNEPTLHVTGKLGAKLAKELGIDVSTADSFVVKMDLGTLNKTEIKWQDLNDALKDQILNLDHEFVQAVIGSKRRKLCIISEVVTTTKETNIQSDLQVQAGADVEASCMTKVSANLDGSFKDTHHRSFDIPSDTVLAYGCYELEILEGLGQMELAIDKRLEDVVSDSTDGSAQVVPPNLDQPDGADSALTSAFNALMKSPKKEDLLQCFREILATPDFLAQIDDLLDDACDSFDKGKVKPYTHDGLKSSLGSCAGWEKLLNLLGLSFDNKKGGKMVYPDEDYKDVVLSCSGLAAALNGLTSNQCLALKDLQPEYCDQLLYLIRNAMYGRNTPADDPKLKRIYTHMPNSGKSFLLALGFKLITEKGKETLALPSDHICPLEDAYIAVFVMASK